jgi:hypothetical protein
MSVEGNCDSRNAAGTSEHKSTAAARGAPAADRSDWGIADVARAWSTAGSTSRALQCEILVELEAVGVTRNAARDAAGGMSALLGLLCLRGTTPRPVRHVAEGRTTTVPPGMIGVELSPVVAASLHDLAQRIGESVAPDERESSGGLAKYIGVVNSLIRRPANSHHCGGRPLPAGRTAAHPADLHRRERHS